MSRNLLDFRFVVRRQDGYSSSTWRLWVTCKSDIYLATSSMAGIVKYSFHTSGICTSAVPSQHAQKAALTNRRLDTWRRPPTPTLGQNGVARIAWLGFPTDYLSRAKEADAPEVQILDSAAPARAPRASSVFVGPIRRMCPR